MCFSPQRRAIFRHLNFKKWSENVSFLTFWLGNVLLATAACNFSTSQLQKVVRTCSVLYILTWKCASRHSGVQFFSISTSKSGPNMQCFVHFDLEMCFSPQRRAIFQHLNCKKWSGADVFCTFSLQNVLLTTAACYFWFLRWPHDSAPAALTSLLFDSPDTRIIGKTQHFATSLTFGAGESSFFWLSRCCSFFLLTLLHLLTLLSSDFTSSICFSSAFQLSILSEVYYLNFLRSCSFAILQAACVFFRMWAHRVWHFPRKILAGKVRGRVVVKVSWQFPKGYGQGAPKMFAQKDVLCDWRSCWGVSISLQRVEVKHLMYE